MRPGTILGSIKKLIPPMITNTPLVTWYFTMNAIGFLDNSNLMPKTGIFVSSVGVPFISLYPVGFISIFFIVLFWIIVALLLSSN